MLATIAITAVIVAPIFTFIGLQLGKRSIKAQKAAELLQAQIDNEKAQFNAIVADTKLKLKNSGIDI